MIWVVGWVVAILLASKKLFWAVSIQASNLVESNAIAIALIGRYRKAIVGGTLEFPGQLIALLLVAQWLQRRRASLVAHVQLLNTQFKTQNE